MIITSSLPSTRTLSSGFITEKFLGVLAKKSIKLSDRAPSDCYVAQAHFSETERVKNSGTKKDWQPNEDEAIDSEFDDIDEHTRQDLEKAKDQKDKTDAEEKHS